jgi:uncharacterized protein (DUF1778 family)
MAQYKEIRVRVTDEEDAEISAAAKRAGMRFASEFMRSSALKEARSEQ